MKKRIMRYIINMSNQIIGQQTLQNELNRYLSSTDLSLSQVARNLEVSKGHLSEIKNGKTDPALNTGLKILKMCGLTLEQRRTWAHFYNSTLSPEYNEVYNDLDRKNLQQINEKLSFQLANNLELLNAYLDIVNREDEGFSLTELRLNYGRKVEEMLKDFVEIGILTIRETDLGKVYHAGKVAPIITTNASYTMAQTMITRAQSAYIREGRDTPHNFQFDDVSEKGVEEIIKLQKETWKKFLDIIEENKQHRNDGGNRIFLNMFFSYLNA